VGRGPRWTAAELAVKIEAKTVNFTKRIPLESVGGVTVEAGQASSAARRVSVDLEEICRAPGNGGESRPHAPRVALRSRNSPARRGPGARHCSYERATSTRRRPSRLPFHVEHREKAAQWAIAGM
jgi:hypothetical protein